MAMRDCRRGRGGPPEAVPRRKPVIGLLGGIGSGKSRVARTLADWGAAVVDADRLGHEALEQSAVREQVIRRWGADICDESGRIVRARLADKVFGRPGQIEALEAIIWPAIRPECLRQVAAAQADPRVRAVVLDAALLVEAGWHELCDWLIFVEAPDEERSRRVQAQRGWGKEEWRVREQAQQTLDRKRALADYVLDNSADWAACLAELRRIFGEIIRCPDGSGSRND